MRKIRMNVTVWQDRNFPFVSIIDHDGWKRNVNGWKISEISKTGKSIEVYVYDGNIITATVNRRLKFSDDRTISFKLNNNHEFHIGNWEEFN